MRTARFRFNAEMNGFLPVGAAGAEVVRSYSGSPSVKDQVGACGIPYTEDDVLLVKGESVGFDRRLEGGDRLSVSPVFEALDVAPRVRLRPNPLRQLRFVLDVHLGIFAGRLRLLGFDTVSRRDATAEALVAEALGRA